MKFRRARRAVLLLLLLAGMLGITTVAWGQYASRTGNVIGTVGGACDSSTNTYGWPDVNGDILKCVSNVWTLVTQPATAAGSTGYVQFNSSGALDASSNLFWDNTLFWLGIGTTAPAGPLQIYGNTNGAEVAYIENPNGGSSASTEVRISDGTGYTTGLRLVKLGTSFPSSGAYVQDSALVLASNAVTGGLSLAASNSNGVIRFYTTGNDVAVERLRIDNAGKVGIGSTSPVVSLDLSQRTDALALPVGTQGQEPGSPMNGMIRYSTTAGDIEAYIAEAWTTLTTGGSTAAITLGTSVATPDPASSFSATTGLFSGASGQVSVTSTGNEIARFTGSGVSVGTTYVSTAAPANGLIVQGNVGIGSTSPAAALDVNGAIDIKANNGISYPSLDTTANGSTVIGAGAVGVGTQSAAYYNTAVGWHAMASTAGTSAATGNTAVGADTLAQNTPAPATPPSGNTRSMPTLPAPAIRPSA